MGASMLRNFHPSCPYSQPQGECIDARQGLSDAFKPQVWVDNISIHMYVCVCIYIYIYIYIYSLLVAEAACVGSRLAGREHSI